MYSASGGRCAYACGRYTPEPSSSSGVRAPPSDDSLSGSCPDSERDEPERERERDEPDSASDAEP